MKIFSFTQFMLNRSLNENVQQAKAYLLKKAKDSGSSLSPEEEKRILNDASFLEIKTLLNANPNWTNVFVRFHFEDGVSLDDLKSLYLLLKQKKNSLNKLPKTIEKYFNSDNKPQEKTAYQTLIDDLEELDTSGLIKKFINNLPGEFIVKNREKTDKGTLIPSLRQAYYSANEDDKSEIKDIVLKFEKLGDNKEETKDLQNQFWSGIKRFRNLREVIEKAYNHIEACKIRDIAQLLLEIEKVNKSLDRNEGVNVLYNKDKKVVFQVFSYEANKKLNAACNHCIVDSEAAFSHYVDGGLNCQLYIWDFTLPITNPKRIIGVTLLPDDEIREASDTNNKKISIGEFDQLMLKKKIPWKNIVKNKKILIGNEEFLEYLKEGNLIKIKMYLDNKEIDNFTDLEYKYILKKIMKFDSDLKQLQKIRFEILDKLISSKKFEEVKFDGSDNPLLLALDCIEGAMGKTDILELMAKQKARIQPELIDELLYNSVGIDEIELAVELFDAKPDFELAIARNSIELVKYMVSIGEIPEKNIDLTACLKYLERHTTLEDESDYRLNLIALLIRLGYKVRSKDKQDLDEEISSGFEVDELLVQAFPIKKITKQKPNKVAELNKKLVDPDSTLKDIQDALDKGADPNFENGRALLNAIEDADEDRVELLLKKGAKIRSDFFGYATRRAIQELLNKYS